MLHPIRPISVTSVILSMFILQGCQEAYLGKGDLAPFEIVGKKQGTAQLLVKTGSWDYRTTPGALYYSAGTYTYVPSEEQANDGFDGDDQREFARHFASELDRNKVFDKVHYGQATHSDYTISLDFDRIIQRRMYTRYDFYLSLSISYGDEEVFKKDYKLQKMSGDPGKAGLFSDTRRHKALAADKVIGILINDIEQWLEKQAQ